MRTCHLFLFIIFILNQCIEASNCVEVDINTASKTYKFQCDGNPVEVNCDSKADFVCQVTIQRELAKYNFKIHHDYVKKIGLFSKTEMKRTTCEISQQECKINRIVCEKYIGTFNWVVDVKNSSFKEKEKCENLLSQELTNTGKLGVGIISSIEFTKSQCSDPEERIVEKITPSIDLFSESILKDLSDSSGYLNKCISKKLETQATDMTSNFLNSNRIVLGEFQNRIAKALKNKKKMTDIVCNLQLPVFDRQDRLDMDKLICAIVEDARTGLNFDSDFELECNYEPVRLNIHSSAHGKNLAEASLTKGTKSNPIEIEALPSIIKKDSQEKLGLTSVLAKAEDPLTGSLGAEQSIAVGATRSSGYTHSDLSKAFQPVYDKLSGMADAASSLGTRSKPTVIGQTTRPETRKPGANRTDLSNTVRVTPIDRKVPTPSDSSTSSVQPEKENVAIASRGDLVKPNASRTPGLARAANAASATSQPAISGTGRAVSLDGGRSISGETESPEQRQTSVPSHQSSQQVQTKIQTLNSSEQIRNFFTSEASNYPQIRELIYNNTEIKRLLIGKQIKVVAHDGRASNKDKDNREIQFEPKYIISDNGVKFNFIPVPPKPSGTNNK